MEIGGNTKVYGIIGNPVRHTQSPVIHNTLAARMGIDMVYVPFPVAQKNLEAAVRGAFGLAVQGINVTVPYKSEVIPFLTEIDELAEKIGAVNTLVYTKKGYKGYNTDITGLSRAMESDGLSVKGEEVIILGAGGAGRMAAFMCVANGAKKVFILNRDMDKAERVAAEVSKVLHTTCITAMPLYSYQELTVKSERKFIVLQCTSIGMSPNTEQAVIEERSFYLCVKAAYDLIYTPWETKFIKYVRENGGVAYNGLKMLLYQAIDAFELWNDCILPVESIENVYDKLCKTVTQV